jgi:hypothetical protein
MSAAASIGATIYLTVVLGALVVAWQPYIEIGNEVVLTLLLCLYRMPPPTPAPTAIDKHLPVRMCECAVLSEYSFAIHMPSLRPHRRPADRQAGTCMYSRCTCLDAQQAWWW